MISEVKTRTVHEPLQARASSATMERTIHFRGRWASCPAHDKSRLTSRTIIWQLFVDVVACLLVAAVKMMQRTAAVAPPLEVARRSAVNIIAMGVMQSCDVTWCKTMNASTHAETIHPKLNIRHLFSGHACFCLWFQQHHDKVGRVDYGRIRIADCGTHHDNIHLFIAQAQASPAYRFELQAAKL